MKQFIDPTFNVYAALYKHNIIYSVVDRGGVGVEAHASSQRILELVLPLPLSREPVIR